MAERSTGHRYGHGQAVDAARRMQLEDWEQVLGYLKWRLGRLASKSIAFGEIALKSPSFRPPNASQERIDSRWLEP